MRRTPLQRRTPLFHRSRLRSRPKKPTREAARQEWKELKGGYCQCGCHRFALRLERHHVCYQQHVRVEHGAEWDLANSMLLHPACHAAHHSGRRRIKLEALPESALAFLVDLLGEGRAAEYVRRYYRT